MNEERGRERRGQENGAGGASEPTSSETGCSPAGFEKELIETFERELEELDGSRLESIGRQLSAEVEVRREDWLSLSRDLEAAAGVAGGEALFRWGPQGWRLERSGASTRSAAARRESDSNRGKSNIGDCVGRLVDDLVEEERVGAWCWREPSAEPGEALRLTATTSAGEVELRAQHQANGATRLRVAAPSGVRDLRLRDRRGGRDLPAQCSTSARVEFELPPQDLGQLELVVTLDDDRREHRSVPSGTPRGDEH